MNRRGFLKSIGALAAALAVPVTAHQVKPETSGAIFGKANIQTIANKPPAPPLGAMYFNGSAVFICVDGNTWKKVTAL